MFYFVGKPRNITQSSRFCQGIFFHWSLEKTTGNPQGKHIILISMKNSNYTLREDLFLLELIPDMNTCTLHMF